MDTIFDRLRADHDKQRTLMDILVRTSGDSRGRQEIFERLKAALEEHAEAEERAFYAPLLEDDVGRKHAAHSIHEHEKLREALEALEEMDFSNPHWLAKAQEMVDMNRHHIDEEETEIFPVAGKVFSATTKRALADTFDEMRRAASA